MPNIAPIQSKLHLEVMNAQQLADIKSATLHVLEHVGVHFREPTYPSMAALRTLGPTAAGREPSTYIRGWNAAPAKRTWP
jgi:trimethylamine:corrinoid methyltransferase-like protein